MSLWLYPGDWINDGVTFAILLLAFLAVRGLFRSSTWGPGVHRLTRNRVGMFCFAIMMAYAAVAVLDSVAWHSGKGAPSKTALEHLFQGVSVARTYAAPLAHQDIEARDPHPVKGFHLLGTDSLGNDVLLLSLKGCRTAWIVGGFTLAMAVPVAILFGISAGYFGGWWDDLFQYIYITLSSIPSIMLIIALMMVMGKGLWQICVALAVTEWIGLARLLRGEALKARDREYVMAARAMGVSSFRVLIRHILPNVFHLVVISATLSFSGLVLSETVLSYIGVGVPSGVGSWGNMINGARLELAREPLVWWNLLGASVFLFVLVLAANFFGDAVRDAFDPRLREA